ncbi:MAG: MFS transporter [Acidimicrobiales bacterium]|nr:MFS transporter [Acidimicrobiales bacterium]
MVGARIRTEVAPSERVKPWAAFEIPEFRYLWGNAFSFALIHSTERFAFVWLMLEVYGRANEAGRITFVLGIPVLFFALQAGALADRVDRRLLMIVTQSGAALVSLALTLLLFADALTYELTLLLAFMLGVSLAFGTPVRISTIPTVVPEKTLMNAIVLNGFAQNVSSIIGPALGGFVIRTWDVKGAFLMSTVLYVVGVLFLLPMRLPALGATADGAPPRRPAREKGAIKEGLRFIIGHAGIRGLFLFLAIAAIFLVGPYGVLVPQVARVRLNREVFEASLMFTALGAGTIVSTIVQASLGDLKRKGAAFLIVCSCCGTMLASVGISTSYPLTICLMFIWGIVGGFFMNLIQTLIQSNTPREYLGRVASVQTLAMQGVTPIGALLAGWEADTFQIMPWLIFSGVCMVGSAVLVAVSQPAFRRM